MSERSCLFGGILLGIQIGLIGSTFIGPRDHPFEQIPMPRQMVDAGSTLQTKTEPGDITLRILSKKDFAAAIADPEAIAFQNFDGRHCVITVPEGWQIDFVPHDAMAWWDNRDNGDSLAHEILHCMVSGWHDQFTERRGTELQAERRAAARQAVGLEP